MNKSISAYILTAVSLGLLIAGLYFIKTLEDPQGILLALPYISVGLGCVIFGHSIGELDLQGAMKRDPVTAKELEIDKNDERNLAIANKAKAKAYDMMVFVFGALLLSIALMGVDLIVVLLLVFSYLFVIVYGTYYRIKFNKEM